MGHNLIDWSPAIFGLTTGVIGDGKAIDRCADIELRLFRRAD